MQKPFLRFRFALWRYKITDEERLVELFRKLLKKYQIVKDQGKKYPTQRIGLSIASSDKQYQTFTRSTTGRQNTVEMYDVISTSTYANNDPSTDSMFDELYDKVLKYFYNNNKSPSLLDDDNLKSAKHFFVFFVED